MTAHALRPRDLTRSVYSQDRRTCGAERFGVSSLYASAE